MNKIKLRFLNKKDYLDFLNKLNLEYDENIKKIIINNKKINIIKIKK